MRRLQIATATLMTTLAAMTAGCGPSEQSRPLSFEQGTYQGERPPPLTQQQVRALQERSKLMQ